MGQCCKGFVGEVLNKPTEAVNQVVNTALNNPIQTAALVATAIYAPELLSSMAGDSESADLALAAESSTPVTASVPSVITGAGGASSSGLAGAGLNSSFDTVGNVLQTGDMSSNFAPSMVDLSGNAPSGVSALGGASTPVASSMGDIMAPTGYTYANGINTANLASAASALSTANNLLNPSQSGGGGGGSSYGFAQPQQLTGTVSGGKAVQVTPYNENLPALSAFHSPNVTPVSTSGIVPSYRSLSSPVYAKEGGDIHDHVGHPEYPKSPLETVFSTRGGTHYVQGKGTGQSDDIDAKLADGEYVFDADTVAALGDGSNKAGAQALDKMRESIRAHKRSAPDNKIPPKAKQPFAYLREGNK
jgi:hypothetical protein